MTNLKLVIENYVSSLPSLLRYDMMLKEIETILESLSETGALTLGHDKDLTGKALEIRIRLLFEKMGFDVVKGRSSMEDFIIKPPLDTQISDPLVLEVKSSQKPNLSRDNLRQLDDWVFDLSGEEKARKEGLGGGVDPLAMVTQGLASRKKRHPTPHKGVLIFNGPVGIDFSVRSKGLQGVGH